MKFEEDKRKGKENETKKITRYERCFILSATIFFFSFFFLILKSDYHANNVKINDLMKAKRKKQNKKKN